MTRNCPESNLLTGPFKSFFSSCFDIIPGQLSLYAGPQNTIKSVITLTTTETIEQLLENKTEKNTLLRLLTSEEKKIFTTYSYQKRRKEWLAGRLACKFAVLRLIHDRLSCQCFPTFSVLPSVNGAPVLSFADRIERIPSISISHSGKYAVAMAVFGQSCGIDIQKVTRKINNVTSHFAEPEEIMMLQNGLMEMNEQQRLTLLWAAKEASKKSLLHDQPAIFKGMKLKSVSGNKKVSVLLHPTGNKINPAKVTAHLLDEYVLAYTASVMDNA